MKIFDERFVERSKNRIARSRFFLEARKQWTDNFNLINDPKRGQWIKDYYNERTNRPGMAVIYRDGIDTFTRLENLAVRSFLSCRFFAIECENEAVTNILVLGPSISSWRQEERAPEARNGPWIVRRKRKKVHVVWQSGYNAVEVGKRCQVSLHGYYKARVTFPSNGKKKQRSLTRFIGN